MSKKKDCMFQFIVKFGDFWPTYKTIEDTGLITWDEALVLFEKYKDGFLAYQKQAETYPEIGIWVDCQSDTDYRIAKVHLDEDTQYDGRRFYNLVREYIEL